VEQRFSIDAMVAGNLAVYQRASKASTQAARSA